MLGSSFSKSRDVVLLYEAENKPNDKQIVIFHFQFMKQSFHLCALTAKILRFCSLQKNNISNFILGMD